MLLGQRDARGAVRQRSPGAVAGTRLLRPAVVAPVAIRGHGGAPRGRPSVTAVDRRTPIRRPGRLGHPPRATVPAHARVARGRVGPAPARAGADRTARHSTCGGTPTPSPAVGTSSCCAGRRDRTRCCGAASSCCARSTTTADGDDLELVLHLGHDRLIPVRRPPTRLTDGGSPRADARRPRRRPCAAVPRPAPVRPRLGGARGRLRADRADAGHARPRAAVDAFDADAFAAALARTTGTGEGAAARPATRRRGRQHLRGRGAVARPHPPGAPAGRPRPARGPARRDPRRCSPPRSNARARPSATTRWSTASRGRNADFLEAYGQADLPCARCGTPMVRQRGRPARHHPLPELPAALTRRPRVAEAAGDQRMGERAGLVLVVDARRAAAG